MANTRVAVGLCALLMLAGGCAANAETGGAGGTAGVGGGAAIGASGGSGGSGGFGALGGSGGFGALGGGGGLGGFAAVDGGFAAADGGNQNLIGPDGGPCVEGVVCIPAGPDDVGCGTLTLNADVEEVVTPGNLLVVFDQSLSMADPFGNSGMPKWTVAKDALAAALAPVADRLTVGAIMFPTDACLGVTGGVAPVTDPRQINFQPGPQFLQTWSQYWANATLVIGTPVQMAMDAADVSLNGAMLSGVTAVVLFTDGAPTDGGLCPAGQMGSPARAGTWLQRGIKTYVVGLPGAGGVQVLRDIAASGGTIDYITPDDPAVLTQQLAMIATSTISSGFDSCSITLNPPTVVPDELQLVVTENGIELGVAHDLGNGAGWTISPDGAQVEITGALCDDAKGGRFSKLEFKFGCVDIPQLPPPPPPD